MTNYNQSMAYRGRIQKAVLKTMFIFAVLFQWHRNDTLQLQFDWHMPLFPDITMYHANWLIIIGCFYKSPANSWSVASHLARGIEKELNFSVGLKHLVCSGHVSVLCMKGESSTLTSPSQMRQLPACLRAPGLTIRAADITQCAEEKAFILHTKLFASKAIKGYRAKQ